MWAWRGQVPHAVVADAGGLLTLAGLVEGSTPEVSEVLALDASALLTAEYLALHHSGAPTRASVDYGLVLAIVQEWFPGRSLALDAATRRVDPSTPIESEAALLLAEMMGIPFFTRHLELTSDRIEVLRP